MSKFHHTVLLLILISGILTNCQALRKIGINDTSYDVVIIGGGASGISAGLQSARMGVRTLIIEPTPWLGGMITAAGVSAFDGNHDIAGGIFREFRDSLYAHYGGADQVATGWVSNTLFEPHVGNRIFKNMARREKNLTIHFSTDFEKINYGQGGWKIIANQDNRSIEYRAKVLIDATELGDVSSYLDVPADIGMDSGKSTDEWFAPEEANDIIQDLTYVAILKDYGEGVDKTIAKPENYDPKEFDCCCDTKDPSHTGPPLIDCAKMLQYGRLPQNKFMINWPNCGNDLYLHIIRDDKKTREIKLQAAKDITWRFLYYLQTELGYKNLGIADDEYETADGLPWIPYHRESRRIKGVSRLLVQHITKPFDQVQAYYRTGIAVGNYPIDHHHKKNPSAPNIDFINIKAPAYNIPLGSLIPASVEHLIVAEKSISVSNIVNGATRLQPVVLGIGQAVGSLAAIAAVKGVTPQRVPIREVQQALLTHGALIMPYIDVPVTDPHFASIQRIGATGILKGTGVAYLWANETWFYPDQIVNEYELVEGLRPMYPILKTKWDARGKPLKIDYLRQVLQTIDVSIDERKMETAFSSGGMAWNKDRALSRRELAYLLDSLIKPFSAPIDHDGNYLHEDSDAHGMTKPVLADSMRFFGASWVFDTIATGVIHQYYHFNDRELFESNQHLHMLRVAKKNSSVQWAIASAGDRLLPTSAQAKEVNALVAVNGSFFDMRQGGSVNFIRQNGITTDTALLGKSVSPYGAHQQGVVAFDHDRFDILKRAKATSGKWEESLPYPNIMESGPLLLYKGAKEALPENPFNDNRHPRSCVCITDEEVIALSADGRNANAQGLSLHELTRILTWLGCSEALNLDGGGSTSFYRHGKGIVNMPCDNRQWDHLGERSVSNILYVKKH